MADNQNTIADKQYLAKILFTREQLDQKTVAKRVGVSEPTMSKWVNEFGWKELRQRLLSGKETLLADLYAELEELAEAIKKRPQGQRYSTTNDADIKVKLTASIRNLETDLGIADMVESGIRFIKYLQKTATFDEIMSISEHWNTFIQASIKR